LNFSFHIKRTGPLAAHGHTGQILTRQFRATKMGYTHYMHIRKCLSTRDFERLRAATRRLRRAVGTRGLKPFVDIEDDRIRLEGFVYMATESLQEFARVNHTRVDTRMDEGPNVFTFVKTYHREPFDQFIVAFACALRCQLGDGLVFGSDADLEEGDLDEGVDLYNEVMEAEITVAQLMGTDPLPDTEEREPPKRARSPAKADAGAGKADPPAAGAGADKADAPAAGAGADQADVKPKVKRARH
jgi:hypothetical protein